MKTPQELKNAAWNVGWPIVLAAGGIVLGAIGMSLCHCGLFAPKIDPAPYPCHDPRMHYCLDGKTCCFDGYACIGGNGTTDPSGPPRCEYVGPSETGERDDGGDHG